MAQIFDEAQHIKDSFSIEQIKEMWSSAIPNINNMAQQTAVEWLIEQLRQLASDPETKYQKWGEAFEQAKQMEKEQEWELKAFWFGRGIAAGRRNKISELKPTKSE